MTKKCINAQTNIDLLIRFENLEQLNWLIENGKNRKNHKEVVIQIGKTERAVSWKTFLEATGFSKTLIASLNL